MHTFHKISFREGLKLVEYALAEAEKINKDIAVAVAGPEGELIAFSRMDGASAAASRIAQNKAYTSARDRKTTREMGEFMQHMQRPPAFWGDMGITGFGGGVPVVQNGEIIGAIGVSGLSEPDDEAICNTAIEKVFGK